MHENFHFKYNASRGSGRGVTYITTLKPKEFNLQGEGVVITEDGGDPRVGRVRSAQAGAWGALGGGLAGGIGGYFGKVNLGGKFQWGTEGQRALAHGVAQGGVSELRGGKFGAGFAAGFFSSFAGSRVQYARVPGYIGVPVGGVVGGLSSRLGGGSFEDGFAQGLAVNAYNHWGDDLAAWSRETKLNPKNWNWDKIKSSVTVKGGVGLGLSIKPKIGPVEVDLGGDYTVYSTLNSAEGMGSVVSGFIGGKVAVGKHAFGLSAEFENGISDRSYNDSPPILTVGYDTQNYSADSNWTLGLDLTPFVFRVGVSVDLKKIYDGVIE